MVEKLEGKKADVGRILDDISEIKKSLETKKALIEDGSIVNNLKSANGSLEIIDSIGTELSKLEEDLDGLNLYLENAKSWDWEE